MRSRLWLGSDRMWRVSGLHDADLRVAVRALLEEEKAEGPVLDEVGILRGQARIDLLHVAPDHLHGFELKSDVDNTVRLGRQVKFFSRAFERCSVVAGERYLDAVFEKVPLWWGVLAVYGDRVARRIRPEGKNPRLDLGAQVQLLWKDGASRLLRAEGVPFDPRAKREQLWELLLTEVEPGKVSAAVRGEITRRA